MLTLTHLRVMACTVILFGVLGLNACSDSDDNGKIVTPIDPNFLDLPLQVGYHCFCWDQLFDGQPAATGNYNIRMVAGTYDNTWDFRIRSGITRIAAVDCCDTSTISIDKSYKDPPDFFGIEMARDTVAWGDTVYFEIAVPAAAQVQLEIKRVGN